MENVRELNKQASEASLNRVATNTVGIINSIRTVGYDPINKCPGDGEEMGTGCAGQWGNHYFILTAKHVINQEARACDLRIFWRPTGEIQRQCDADLRPRDIADGVPINDANAVIHRCQWEDLAVVAINPKEAGQYTEFFDIANEWIDPAEGEVLHCCGFPFDKNITVDKRMIGIKEERTIAIRPDLFSGEVLRQPTEQELKFQITAYDPDQHYLIPYEHSSSKHFRGFSGAATWWEIDQQQLVWKPNFKFAGICTSCYKGGAVEQVVKASAVRRFLDEVFGQPNSKTT